MNERGERQRHVHIFGASGSGTTTIAKAVCERLGYVHFDSDNYFWIPTDEPFTVERNREESLQLLENDLKTHGKWVLSGSLADWGNAVIPYFDLVVFVYLPHDVRMERLKNREFERNGDEIFAGGKRYDNSKTFLTWAASYDDGGLDIRSKQSHEQWLKRINCPVVRIINNVLDDSVNAVVEAVCGY